MRRSLLGAAVTALLLLSVSACGGGGNDDLSASELEEELSSTLQGGDTDFTKEEADCYAALIVEIAGVDKLQDVDLSADAPPDAIKVDVAAATLRAESECGITVDEDPAATPDGEAP